MSVSGATGPAGPDPEKVTMRFGTSYAFRIDGTEMFLEVIRHDGTTGFLELRRVEPSEHFRRWGLKP